MTRIYMLVGAPGSGKTWVAQQLRYKFEHLEHDDFIKNPDDYISAILNASKKGGKPVLCNASFSISRLLDPLIRMGAEVQPIYILESHDVTKARYEMREKKPIPKSHLSLIKTYRERAISSGAPQGTSAEILKYLQSV